MSISSFCQRPGGPRAVRAAALGLAALPLLAGTAHAALTCATLSSASGSYSKAAGIEFSLNKGDRIVVRSISNATGQIAGASEEGGVANGLNIIFTGSAAQVFNDTASGELDGVVTISPLVGPGFPGGGPASLSIPCVAGAGGTGGDGGAGGGDGGGDTGGDTDGEDDVETGGTDGDVTTPDVVGDPDQIAAQLLRAGVAIGASGQVVGAGANIRGALGRIFGRVGGVTAGPGGLFVSTRGDGELAGGLDAWASFGGQVYDGEVDGTGLSLGAGIQAEVSPGVVLGLAADYSTLELETGGQEADIEALVVGPYLGFDAGGAQIDAYMLYGRPDYDLGAAGSGDAERLIFGVSASTEIEGQGMLFSPYVSVSGYREQIGAVGAAAARDVEQRQLSLGTRIDFGKSPASMPYVTLGIDAYEFEDAGVTDSNVSPSIGAGYALDVGTGTLSIDFDASEVATDVRRYGLGLRYDMRF